MALDAGFKSLLQQRLPVERFLQEDLWGNEGYGPATIEIGFCSGLTNAYGSVDGDDASQTEAPRVKTGEVTMDYTGIALGDRITVAGVHTYVTGEETFLDETGVPLYQQVTVSTQKRG